MHFRSDSSVMEYTTAVLELSFFSLKKERILLETCFPKNLPSWLIVRFCDSNPVKALETGRVSQSA